MSAYLRTILEGLFTKPIFEGDLEACNEQGEAAGDQAYGRDQNPYRKGTQSYEWWDAGWCESTDELIGR